MKLAVAAPVFNRAWALPTWYECLAAQTRRPDDILFVHGGARGDETWEAIDAGAASTRLRTHRLHDDGPTHPRQDNERFHTLARLRNHMLAGCAVFCDADIVLSLDTDIMLEDPTTIERLLAALVGELGQHTPDVVSCLTHFHPDMGWTCNAGYLGNDSHHPREALEAGRPEDLAHWQWRRAEIDPQFAQGGVQPIDIPMGIVMMSRRAYREQQVRYMWHEAGEDIGYGVNLKLADLTAGWIPSLKARHVWDPSKL